MAVRIYALAKELDFDSKELVDICTRAGVPGKGSALASLSEDEVAKVKEFLSGGTSGGATATAAPAKPTGPPPMQRPTGNRGGGKLRTISAPKAGLATTRVGRIDEVAAEVEQPIEEPAAAPEEVSVAAETPVEEVAAEPVAVESGAAESAAVEPAEAATEAKTESGPAADEPSEADKQRAETEATIAGAAADKAEADESRQAQLSQPGPLARMMGGGRNAGGKMPVIGGDKGAGAGGAKKPAPKARPTVKLAALPARSAPKKEAPKAKDEAKAQKPDMKLPSDVLGGAKGGAKPLGDQLRRAERSLEAAKLKEKEEAAGKGTRGKTGVPMLGGREQRQLTRNRGGGRANFRPRRFTGRRRKSGVNSAAPRKDAIQVQLPCTVKQLSEAAGVAAVQILRILMEEGVMTNINAVMDPELTELVAAELGVELDFIQAETLEDKLLTAMDELEDPAESLKPRAPVVTFLGHVDHGKTSLLDRLIGIKVADGEDGGITQHIRAYQLENDGRPISFVDTPGHEAFTEMRARGAGVTDIVVLVIAADDGIMPQTEEAISHAKAAGVPIIVALNKIDLPGVDENKALQGLTANELLPSEWGGDVEVVKTSATVGTGMDELLETILTVAELNEYTANPDRSAIGSCLESQQDADKGVMTKILVQKGTLKVGDIVVCGDSYGKVKSMTNPLKPSQRLQEAGPSVPVNLTGLNRAPSAGEPIYVLDDIAQAREIAETREHEERTESLGNSGFQAATLENLFDRLDGAAEVQTLNLIIRADVRGTIEALEKELSKLQHPEVRLRILQKSVGAVSEGDILLAEASDAVIIAFNVVPDDKARARASQAGVEIRRYGIIYKVADDLKLALEGMLKPEEREVELGRVLVQMIFKISRIGVIAGCRVLQGVVQRNARARVVRDNTIVGDYRIDTLRREKDDTKEVREGYECGIKLAGFNDIKEADLLEVYKVEEITRNFDD